MPGMVIGVSVKVGDTVTKGQKLLALEAMKMETIISADRDGTVEQLLVKSGSQVSAAICYWLLNSRARTQLRCLFFFAQLTRCSVRVSCLHFEVTQAHVHCVKVDCVKAN